MSVKVELIEEGKVINPSATLVAVPRVGDHVHWTQSVGEGPAFVVTKVSYRVREEGVEEAVEVHLARDVAAPEKSRRVKPAQRAQQVK